MLPAVTKPLDVYGRKCRCGEYVSQSSNDLAPKDLELLRGGCKGGLKLDSLF